MAIINDNFYIKITPQDIEQNRVYVDFTLFNSKADRDLQKQYEVQVKEMLVKTEQLLEERYSLMLEEATRLGFQESDYQTQEQIDAYGQQHPTFKVLYDSYHAAHRDIYELQAMIDGVIPVTREKISELYELQSLFPEDIYYMLVSCNVAVFNGEFPIVLNEEFSQEELYSYCYNKVKESRNFGETEDC